MKLPAPTSPIGPAAAAAHPPAPAREPGAPDAAVLPDAVPPSRIPMRRRLLYLVILLVMLYGGVELIATMIFRATVPSTYWLYEGRGPAVRFDAKSGYRVIGEAARVAKFARSRDPRKAFVEYLGAVAGNAQGFPDRSDFSPARTDPAARRLVVFGDSFTGGDLPVHWPDRCEDEAAAAGRKLDLLNFSQSGIGLANWHRMLTTIVAPEKYDIDGVVFAVWGNDLARRFYVCDQGEGSAQLGGRVQSWDPADYPKTREEALRWMAKWDGRVVTHAEFDGALRGEWAPSRPWEPFLAKTLLDRLRTPAGGAVGAVAAGQLAADLKDTTQGRGRLAAEIRDTLRAMGKPVFIVKIPSIEELLTHTTAPADDDARALAGFLGAEFADGGDAFAGLDQETVRAHWFPRDLHWAQSGSDRFAAWMAGEIQSWSPGHGIRSSAPIPPGESR